MNEADITRYLTETFTGIDVLEHGSDRYYYYDPERNIPHDKRWPFATLMTSDAYDQVSNLNRPDVFRLNVGVSKETFISLFGGPVPKDLTERGAELGYDFAALDVLLPHPVYGSMYWVSVLNPGAATWERTRELLAEAHRAAEAKHGQ